MIDLVDEVLPTCDLKFMRYGIPVSQKQESKLTLQKMLNKRKAR